MDTSDKFRSNKDILISQAGPNLSAAARSGGHVTAPILTNNSFSGNVHIINNAPGFTLYHPHSEKTPTSATRSIILKYKKQICSEYQYVSEYNSLPGEQVLLSERFTQPLIIQKYRDQKEIEEEIRSSGESFSSRSSDESVHLNSLFDPDNHRISPRAVILQGNSGNGKTFTVQKIMMDWASGDLYKEQFNILFHLKCKEINYMSGKKSLVDILSYNCSLTSDQISQILQQSPEKVLFIIDGFDELRLTQDVNPMSPHTDPLKRAPPEVTLCALLRGHIMPESFLLVTTRSTATDTLKNMLKGPHRFTEIMGFSEKGMEEYFQKFFQNEEFFRKAYGYVKANETLITACSIPVVCWIICTVMRERFSDGSDLTSGLETTTSMYVDFVCTLLEHHYQGLSRSIPTLLRSLGQLAEKGLLEQQVLFDEKTVYETVSDPAGSPFLSKFLFKKRVHQEMMFSFMHLSFQEFFTALFYASLDSETLKEKLEKLRDSYCQARYEAVLHSLFGLLNKEVRETLKRKHGVFVCPNTLNILKEFLHSENEYSLLHCLYELHEQSFVEEVLNAKKRIIILYTPLRRTDCWALLYCFQCCQSIEELMLWCNNLTLEKLLMILPVLHKCKHVKISPEAVSDSALVDLIHALTRGRTLSSQSVEIHCIQRIGSLDVLELSFSEELSRIKIVLENSCLPTFSFTFLEYNLLNIDWTNLFRALQTKNIDVLMFVLASLPGVKKMELWSNSLTESLANQILSLCKNCPSLTELRINSWVLDEGIKVLQKSRIRPDCTLTFEGVRNFGDSWEKVRIYLNAGGFSIETLRPSLFSTESGH